MLKNDYSNESDFYSQGFEQPGMVSIWVGLMDARNEPDADTLQDLCGVGYYRLDDQETNCFDYEEVDIDKLTIGLSYSESFLIPAVTAAKIKGIIKARWITAQYDFAYDSEKICRSIADDPVFIGSFSYMASD